MAFDMSGYGNVFNNYVRSGGFWLLIIIVILVLGFFFFGYFTRKSKLKYNCLEVVRFGNGKVGLNKLEAGFFKAKTFMFFFDYGNEFRVKTSDNRVIEGGKSSQLHDVFGKKGFIVVRSPHDPKVLIPLSRFQIEGLGLLGEIAPADFRDASVRIYREAIEETKGMWDKILPYLAVGLCILLCIITIVITQQMTNHTIDKVGNMLISGCSNSQNVAPSTAP
jgi:hypothetical protein